MSNDTDKLARQGRLTALLLAGVGLYWIGVTALGSWLDWTQRTRALFDLLALAGFGTAIWMIYGLWRARQKDKE